MTNDVNTPSPTYDAMEEDRKLPRILLYDGQRGIRDAGETYLPKYGGEQGSADAKTTEYGGRLARSFLVNFYRDAVQNLVGRIFAEPLVFSEDTPQVILDLWKNIDDCGTSGDIFIQRVAIDALGQGVSEVLVDFQRPDAEFVNAEQEARAGLRPKWVHYKAHDVIEALGDIINGRPYLKRARIRQRMIDADGYDYGTDDRVREYLMGNITADPVAGSGFYAQFRIHTQDADGNWFAGEWLPMEPPNRAAPEQRAMFIEPPLVPFYGENTGFHEGRPPLIGVSDLNLQHYQLKSNIDGMEYRATTPTLLRIGADANEGIEVGAGRVIDIPQGATLQWLEIQGNGVQHAKDSLRHLEEHIRLAGREPMVKKATGSELATVRLLDEAQHLTTAQAWAVSWIASIQRCLDLTAGWLGIPSAGTVRIDESVMEALSRPQGFEDVKELAALGFLSQEQVLKEAKRYGILDREFDVDAAVEELENEEPIAIAEPEPDEQPIEVM